MDLHSHIGELEARMKAPRRTEEAARLRDEIRRLEASGVGVIVAAIACTGFAPDRFLGEGIPAGRQKAAASGRSGRLGRAGAKGCDGVAFACVCPPTYSRGREPGLARRQAVGPHRYREELG
jgi:hypothetical protein